MVAPQTGTVEQREHYTRKITPGPLITVTFENCHLRTISKYMYNTCKAFTEDLQFI